MPILRHVVVEPRRGSARSSDGKHRPMPATSFECCRILPRKMEAIERLLRDELSAFGMDNREDREQRTVG
ncbi:hypothetical protein E4U55_004124 [Claviceps digitariae]|nr:hypothetical protein E4U55_004124 [Claviceps digitariae]